MQGRPKQYEMPEFETWLHSNGIPKQKILEHVRAACKILEFAPKPLTSESVSIFISSDSRKQIRGSLRRGWSSYVTFKLATSNTTLPAIDNKTYRRKKPDDRIAVQEQLYVKMLENLIRVARLSIAELWSITFADMQRFDNVQSFILKLQKNKRYMVHPYNREGDNYYQSGTPWTTFFNVSLPKVYEYALKYNKPQTPIFSFRDGKPMTEVEFYQFVQLLDVKFKTPYTYETIIASPPFSWTYPEAMALLQSTIESPYEYGFLRGNNRGLHTPAEHWVHKALRQWSRGVLTYEDALNVAGPAYLHPATFQALRSGLPLPSEDQELQVEEQ